MQRAIEKRSRKHPFDYAYAEGFTLEMAAAQTPACADDQTPASVAGAVDPVMNNSYYFSAHGGEMSLYLRLGKRVHQDETWLALYCGGEVYSLEQELFPAGESPILVEKDGADWTLSFDGILSVPGQQPTPHPFHLSARFLGKERPIDFTTDMPSLRMATGVANERWSKAFFQNLQSISGQCHYEQEGILEGEFTLDGETKQFCLPCVRDHSFGKRDWNYMNNHLWLMGVSADVQLNYSLVSYPALSVLEVGHLREDNHGLHFMHRADLDLPAIGKGSIPQELSFRMVLDDGCSVPITAKVLATVTYHFQDGAYVLHENIAEFAVDGKILRGILEIGFNRDARRIFNGRALDTIRR